MVCFYPLSGYRSVTKNENGRRPVFFRVKVGKEGEARKFTLACGQCVGCRLERSRQWAVRCMHESKLHEKNCFITLTYDSKWILKNGSLSVKDFQLFMKKFRKKYGKIRFFHCGEYGPKLERPHYHALIFGFDFDDKKIWKKNGRDEVIYTSEKLTKLWGMGHCTVCELTFDTAAYCARYTLKKITGRDSNKHYERVDPETGEVVHRKPEYCTMSRRPGIGRGHLDKFVTDVYPSDYLIVNGKKARPPRFYDNIYEVMDPLTMEEVKFNREVNGEKHWENNTKERLAVREEVTKRRLKHLKREIG